jgi:7,8-dihydro-6-hydroxymethylpterin dimethyltransferase
VRGINFQPLAIYGKSNGHDLSRRMTLTGILRKIEQQTDGLLSRDDFIPLPCDVHRIALTYLYREGGRVEPITREIDFRKYLPMIGNTFAFNADDFLDAGCCLKNGEAARLLLELAPLIPRGFLTASLPEKVAMISRSTFRISVSSFIDAHNFDPQSMRRECVHIVTPDLRRIPFSAYNMLHRNR